MDDQYPPFYEPPTAPHPRRPAARVPASGPPPVFAGQQTVIMPPRTAPPVPVPWVPPPPPPSPTRRRRRQGFWRVARWALLILLVVSVIGGALAWRRLDAFGTAISSRAPFSTAIATSGRINVILLGYGGPGHDGPYLTDSILVMSYDTTTNQTALISVPRDLWVQIPPNSGHYAKLNDAYAYGMAQGGRDVAGALAALKVSQVLGMSTPYWISVNFGGFTDLVNAIGGVDLTVARDFHASTSPTYAPYTVFHAGPQHMDGATALLYARARYCTPAVEGSDFARSARQQILIEAIISKLKSPGGWPKITAALDALQPTLATNLSLRDALWFLARARLSGAQHIGLTNQNVLQDAVSSDGQDILLPRDGNWSLITQYVQQQLASGG